jgi:hypothetical protein
MSAAPSSRQQDSIDAGFEQILEGNAPDVIATAHALREAIRGEIPEVVEVIDPGNGLLALGTTAAMRDLLFAIIPHKSHVNLQLADGVELPNESGLIEGTGKRIRHVKARSVVDARSDAVRSVIRSQIEYRRS